MNGLEWGPEFWGAHAPAAKLNVANGSDPSPISSTIDDADALLSGFAGKLSYAVERSSDTGQAMESDVTVLIDYNLGNLTTGCGQ